MTFLPPLLLRCLLAAVSVLLAGCGHVQCCIAFRSGEGDGHRYLVLGLGVITVPKPEQASAVIATRVQALGLFASGQPGLRFGLGYSSGSSVAVPESTNELLVDVNTCSATGLSIKTKFVRPTGPGGAQP